MPATQLSWVGLDMALYRNTATNVSPTWVLISNVRDLKQGSALGEADASGRHSKKKQSEPTLQESVYNWGMNRDETDAQFLALRSAKDSRTLVEFAFANGPIATSGTTYYREECKIFGFDEEEPLEGTVVVDVTAKPCHSTNAPGWTVVA